MTILKNLATDSRPINISLTNGACEPPSIVTLLQQLAAYREFQAMSGAANNSPVGARGLGRNANGANGVGRGVPSGAGGAASTPLEEKPVDGTGGRD